MPLTDWCLRLFLLYMGVLLVLSKDIMDVYSNPLWEEGSSPTSSARVCTTTCGTVGRMAAMPLIDWCLPGFFLYIGVSLVLSNYKDGIFPNAPLVM